MTCLQDIGMHCLGEYVGLSVYNKIASRRADDFDGKSTRRPSLLRFALARDVACSLFILCSPNDTALMMSILSPLLSPQPLSASS